MARVSRLRAGAPVAGSSWPLGGVVILAVLLAVAGVVVSAGVLSGGAPRATPAASAEFAVGAFTVREGPRESTLEVEAAVTLMNRTDRAIAYAVSDFGLLTTASEAPLEVQRATLGAGDLPPGGAIDARLIFVAPAGGVPLALLLRDEAGGRSRVTPRPSRPLVERSGTR